MKRVKFQDLAARLAWARGVSGLSAKALSLRAALSPSHVSMIESGERADIRFETAEQLAEVLGVPVLWLFKGAGDQPTESQIKKAVAGAA
jgi:transcriptional regulator with XRE-family HTH domain